MRLSLNMPQTFLLLNVQDHAVLETALPFRIVLYWKRLTIDTAFSKR